ncbi:hypothetical protein RA8CHR_01212 [Variovorax sp. RA8]|nr:hypothetical protein RA8CHR_01212 [Variovorax sp. RA8]
MAALLATMAALIVLPIPLGNLLPATSIAALGLAVVFGDQGLAALRALALAFTGGVTVLAAHGGWCAVASTCSLL